MDQLHKRFTVEQVKVLLQGYVQGTMSRAEVEEMLNIGVLPQLEILLANYISWGALSITGPILPLQW
jgi:hypothetical protein